ncbi:MAG: hypothetical protein EPN50_01050 [Chloroflexota bacterium]|nr:MAG: hypothetical protein EPN50_01050 [Chloroflexota bacterium]
MAIDPLDESTISVSIKLPFSPAESLGYALRSIDGGGTWTAMNLPNGEPVRFRTALDGWQAGGAVDQTLSRTQDAGATWQSVAVAIPPAYAGDRAAYSNPVFFGTSGVLPVFLWVPGGGPLIAAFYTTVTAGDRWSLAASVEAAPDGSSMPVVVTGPQSWLVDTNHGLLATTDAKTFSPLAASGLDPSTVATLHATGTTIWAVTSVSSCTVAKTACTTSTWLERSSNNGENWAPSSP